MAIRKEQVLLLVTAAVGALLWRSSASDPRLNQRFVPVTKEYAVQPVVAAPLVTGAATAPAPRPWFREPSETQPLPPRELPFPAIEPLFVVALPLEIGPDLAHAERVRMTGDVVEGVTLQSGGDAQAAAPAAGESGGEKPDPKAADKPAGEAQGVRAEAQQRWSRVYDQLWLEGQRAPLLGVVTPVGADRFDLEDDKFDFAAVKIEFLQFNLSTEKLLPSKVVFDADNRQKVVKVRLAETLKNEVERRRRRIPSDIAHAPERLALIDWLLMKGREEGWVYDVALQQADLLRQQGGGIEALRARVKVLRARGDVAQEFEAYKEAQGDGAIAAFRHEGIGQLQFRLGLWRDAEHELRQAVAAMPTDARTHASLAGFLRERWLGQEAVAEAQKAAETLGAVTDEEDRRRVITTIVACHLGVGDIAAARAMLGNLRGDSVGFLRACIDYAAGDLAAAKDGFRQAAQGLDAGSAMIGYGACLLRQGAWQEALSTFESVADQSPLQRHRAQAGIGLLHFKLGQYDAAIAALDRALEAAPLFVYAHYLKGRVLRAAGQLGPAQEALQGALRLRDDCAPALAEMAAVRTQMAASASAAEQAGHALAAMRYSDRAVALSSIPLVPLMVRQAMAHFAAADPRGAIAAFERARAQALEDKNDDQARLAQAGLAVLDYSQDRTEDALASLERMIQDLQANKEHPLRKWAEATRRLIDDHAQKEQLDDRFERGELGAIWDGGGSKRDGALGAVIVDHGMVFKGQFSKAGEVSAVRAGAVSKGKNFLAVSARVQLGAEHKNENSDSGLRIQSRIGSGGSSDFVAWTGFREGKPFLFVQDGREDPVQPTIKPADGSPRNAHQVEFRVEPRDDQGRSLRLLCIWDGDVVHQMDIKMLTGQSSNELETSFFVKGAKGANADVRFDDYHLERRKDV